MGLRDDRSVEGAESRVPGSVPVRLEAVGHDMMAVVRVVRAHTGLDLPAAHALVGSAPCEIPDLDGHEAADALVEALEDVGARASSPFQVSQELFELDLDGLRGRVEPIGAAPPVDGMFAAILRGLLWLTGLISLPFDPFHRPRAQRFHVRHGVLVVTEEHPLASTGAEGERVEAVLAGATVRVFDDGLWIRPALGPGVRLQGRGTRGTFERLAELLREEGRRTSNRGSSADVPESLAGMTEPDDRAE